MGKRNREVTVQKITNASLEIFEENGFLAASTEDIAKNAGVAHGTIFFYFPTKADLIIHCIFEKLGPLAEKLNEKSRRSDNVGQLCRIFLEEVEQHANFYARLVKDLPHLPNDLQRSVFSSLSGFSIHFVEVIEYGQKTGKIKLFEPKLAIFFWFGVMHYLFSYRELLGTEHFTTEDQEHVVQFFMNALLKNH